MDGRRLSEEQLQEHLRRQLKHLRNSARLFDGGDDDEAVRLGTTARVLMHETGASRSLLGQLGLREAGTWVDTGVYRADVDATIAAFIEREYGPDSGLVAASQDPGQVGLVDVTWRGGKPFFTPGLNRRPFRRVDVDTWWARPLIETSGGAEFSRQQLVSAMANKDGGAHVDPRGDVAYEAFVVDDLGISYADEPGDWTTREPPGGWKRFGGNVAAVSMRQIAYEIECTLYGLNLPWLSGEVTVPHGRMRPD